MNIQDFINEVRARLRETDTAAHRYVHPVWGESNRDFGPIGNPTFEKPEANSLLDLRDSKNLKTALEIIEALMPLAEAADSAKDACLCERNTYGFDYGEEHSKLGKPASGKRWLTPSVITKTALTTMHERLKGLK